MKKLFLLFFVLLIAIGLGFLIHKDPGYAIVSYDHWVIGTSVWVAAACEIIAFVFFYFIIRMVINIFAIPKKLKRRRQFLNAQKYKKYMTLGISELAKKDDKKAKKYFLKLKKCGLISEEEFNHIILLELSAS